MSTQNTNLTAPLLSEEQRHVLVNIQNRFTALMVIETDYHRDRALSFRTQFRFVADAGKLALENHVEMVLGFNVDAVRSKGYKVCAMGVTGIDPAAEPDKEKKRALENKVLPVTQALDVLFHFKADHQALSDDEFVTWYNDMGRLVGLVAAWKVSLAKVKPAKAKPANAGAGANAASADGADELDESATFAGAISELIGNQTAVEVSGLDLAPGVTTVYVAQGLGDKARMVRLEVNAAFIAGLAEYAPDPLTNASQRLLFFRQLLMSATSIVPNMMSDEPVVPLGPVEKKSATTPMRPANAVILYRDGVFSVASSRLHDTIVMEVQTDDDVVKRVLPEGFIDTVTRGTMTRRLSSSHVAAGYVGQPIEVGLRSDDEGRLEFQHRDAALSGQLLVKPLSSLNSMWTSRIRGFKHAAGAELWGEDIKHLKSHVLALLTKSKSTNPLQIAFKPGEVSFKHGGAAAVTFKNDSIAGTEAARVMKADFMRAMSGLLDLPLVNEISFTLDPRGALMIAAVTEAAVFRVYVQTLAEGHGDAHVRSRELLERVGRPDQPAEQLAA